MFKFLVSVLPAILCAITSVGQIVKVTGKVVGSEKKCIQAVAVTIQDKQGKLLGGSITDSLGNFVVEYKKGENAFLMARHIAFRTDTVLLSGTRDTSLVVSLYPYWYEMGEVKVKANRSPIRYVDGDIVINVENFQGKGTERSVDILRKLPGVFINEESKQIVVNGKPVELQIDGRTQYVTYDLLKALPVKILDRIVVIPNKRAEHDGDRGTAVIDLKTKKKFIDGYTGNFDGNYGMYKGIGMPGEAEGSLFTMLMKKDFYLNIMFHAEANTDREEMSDSTYYQNNNTWTVYNREVSDRPWASITNMNLSWNLGRGNRISANLYAFTRNWDETAGSSGIDQNYKRTRYDVQSDGNRWNISGNAEYESSDSLPFKLKVSYGYIGAGEHTKDNREYSYPDLSGYGYTYRNRLSGRQHLLKVDFRKVFFRNKLSVNVGMKVNYGKTTNETEYMPESVTFRNDFFDYRERVWTEYVSLGYTVSKKVFLNAGLRMEQTDYDLDLESTEERGEDHYGELFPSMNVFLNLHKNYNTSFSFHSGMGRPNYNLLAPKEIWYNDRYYSKGNPDLKPCKNYTLEWGNTLFQRLSLALSGMYTKDFYSQVLMDKGNGLTESTFMNSFDAWQVAANLSLPVSLLKGRLNVNIGTNYKYGKYLHMRNGFVLPEARNRNKELSSMIYAEYWFSDQYRLKIYASAVYNIVSESFLDDVRPCAWMNMGIRYKFLEKQPLYLVFFTNDTFDSQRIKKTSYYDNNVKFYHHKEKTQGFFLGLSYSFQGGKDLKREEKTEDQNAEDKRFDEN